MLMNEKRLFLLEFAAALEVAQATIRARDMGNTNWEFEYPEKISKEDIIFGLQLMKVAMFKFEAEIVPNNDLAWDISLGDDITFTIQTNVPTLLTAKNVLEAANKHKG